MYVRVVHAENIKFSKLNVRKIGYKLFDKNMINLYLKLIHFKKSLQTSKVFFLFFFIITFMQYLINFVYQNNSSKFGGYCLSKLHSVLMFLC